MNCLGTTSENKIMYALLRTMDVLGFRKCIVPKGLEGWTGSGSMEDAMQIWNVEIAVKYGSIVRSLQ